jgi:hypothetical protein
MRRALAVLAAIAGIGFLALGTHIAIFGAERELPPGPDRVEGVVLPGRATPSPAGEAFLFGRIRVRSAARDGKSMAYVDRTFGDPGIRVETEGGVRALILPSPDEWRVPSGHEDRATMRDLGDLPLLDADDVRRIGQTIPPPYEVSVRAVRPGDHVLARAGATEATRVSVGDEAALARDSAAQDATRWPIVLLLLAVGTASCVAAVVAARSARAKS